METGFKGTFVISWAQTEIDGLRAAATDMLKVGAAWRWNGDAVRVDGPAELLILDGAQGAADIRKRAAKAVRKLVGAAMQPKRQLNDIELDEPVLEGGFVLTDGQRTYTATMIEVGRDARPLLMFLNEIPPAATELWVVSCAVDALTSRRSSGTASGVICFTRGTMILTPDGPRLVEDLTEGDMLQTKDDGGQQIQWIGQRRMTGARLYAMPHLRPVRIKAGALSNGEPDDDLLVSPDHRLLIKGKAASALFNTSEVLVSAKDLVNDSSILIDHSVREVTYIHMMLERHQVVWANGVETESFHPANTLISEIDQGQQERLFEVMPDLRDDAQTYGEYARRNLSPSEAEILKYDRMVHH